MKRFIGGCLLSLALSCALSAQDLRHITIANVQDHTPVRHWAWIGSMGFLAAGQMMDWQSSLGKHEANALIGNRNGQFDASRGLTLKLAIVGGAIGTQVLIHHLHHSHQSDAMFSVANVAMGSIGLMTAVHNYGVAKAPKN